MHYLLEVFAEAWVWRGARGVEGVIVDIIRRRTLPVRSYGKACLTVRHGGMAGTSTWYVLKEKYLVADG